MYQSRDDTRQVFLDVWKKILAQQLLEPMETIIADVIQLHPEYHALLDSDKKVHEADYSVDNGQTNPFLHMGMHIALREQTSVDRPPGIKQLHQKLMKKKGIHEAEHAMMECLGQALWFAQRNQTLPDETAYLDCLKKL
ncbi:MAG: DUF1841 family protein [Gammaproteobacteria bacterium]|nr:DUF1841 family protein [Gammaproteobacteria bacterium]